jgi:anaerobic ribonucleoside-triphosphate reductase activating protein
MIKYLNTAVTFAEIPTEVTLAINITNCTHNCIGCHSPELREDIGEELTPEVLLNLILKNSGISCVLFLGEGNSLSELNRLVKTVKNSCNLKFALYSGAEKLPNDVWWLFDYVKIGPYKEECGPINKVTTNQRLYKKVGNNPRIGILWDDITKLFWR